MHLTKDDENTYNLSAVLVVLQYQGLEPRYPRVESFALGFLLECLDFAHENLLNNSKCDHFKCAVPGQNKLQLQR